VGSAMPGGRGAAAGSAPHRPHSPVPDLGSADPRQPGHPGGHAETWKPAAVAGADPQEGEVVDLTLDDSDTDCINSGPGICSGVLGKVAVGSSRRCPVAPGDPKPASLLVPVAGTASEQLGRAGALPSAAASQALLDGCLAPPSSAARGRSEGGGAEPSSPLAKRQRIGPQAAGHGHSWGNCPAHGSALFAATPFQLLRVR
jgi:hypothetical protein